MATEGWIWPVGLDFDTGVLDLQGLGRSSHEGLCG